jgi:hypothetical protein
MLLAALAVAAWMYWPEDKGSVEVSFDENWKMGSSEMEVIRAYHDPCLFCAPRDGAAPSINFIYDGVNYSTSRKETSRIFVKPEQVPKDALYANIKNSSQLYQGLFVAARPMDMYPNSVIAAIYVMVDGKNVYYFIEEVYDPGWAYELSLKPDNSGKTIVEHSLKLLSMMMYSLTFLLVGFVLSIIGYHTAEKMTKNR